MPQVNEFSWFNCTLFTFLLLFISFLFFSVFTPLTLNAFLKMNKFSFKVFF